MNPISLALIGIPLMLGVYFRFRRFDRAKFELSAAVTALVFIAVAIGFVFMTHDQPKPAFANYNGWFCLACILITWYFGSTDASSGFFEKYAGFVGSPLVWAVFWLALPEVGLSVVTYAAAALLTFVVLALTNAALGTIAAGFTISTAIHAFVIGNGLPDMFIWKDVFEFLEISSSPMKIVILVTMALASSVEAIAAVLD